MTSLWYRDASRQGLALVIWLVGAMSVVNNSLAQTIVVPTLTVSETYDSNVFWTPKTLLPPGTKPEDLITSLVPQLTVGHMGSKVQGSFSAGALITRYINNSELDYTGVNVTGNANFTQWAKGYSQRITNLAVTGLYTYSPSMNQFGMVGGQYGAGYGSFGQAGLGTGFNAGLVTNRVDFHNINVGVTGGYQLTRTTSVTGSYFYNSMFFGNQEGADNQLFNTDGHTATITLARQLTQRDSVGTTATISHYIQDQSNGTGQGSFTTPSGTANWLRRWTQKLSTSMSGGAMFILPIESTVPGQSTKTQVAPTTTVTLNYTSFSEALRAAGSELGAAGYGSGAPVSPFSGLPAALGSVSPGSILPPGQYSTTFTYNYMYYPSYAFGAGAIAAHVVAGNLSAGITPKLSGLLGVNYAHGSSVASSFNFTYDTVGVTAGAQYLLGPILASLTYNWLYAANSAVDVTTGSADTAFSKKSIMLALSYAFMNRSFFKAGAFADWGLFGSGEKGSGSSGTGSPTAPASGGSLKKE